MQVFCIIIEPIQKHPSTEKKKKKKRRVHQANVILSF